MNKLIKTDSYSEIISYVVFGATNKIQSWQKVEELCDELFNIKVPKVKRDKARGLIEHCFNDQVNGLFEALILAVDLLQTIGSEVFEPKDSVKNRLLAHDRRVSHGQTQCRQGMEIKATARWLLVEMISYYATGFSGLQGYLQDNKARGIEQRFLVEDFRIERFRRIAERCIECSAKAEWITPGILVEFLSQGVFGGGNWFKDEFVFQALLLWPTMPKNPMFMRFKQNHLDAAPIRLWQPSFVRNSRPGRTIKNEFRFDFLDWLGAIWLDANQGIAPWKGFQTQIDLALDALIRGGAFICRSAKPSPQGWKYLSAFWEAMNCINEALNRQDSSAGFHLWFDWDYLKTFHPSRRKNVERGPFPPTETENAMYPCPDDRYEMRLDISYRYRLQLAKLIADEDEAGARLLIKKARRERVPPHLISDWIMHSDIYAS